MIQADISLDQLVAFQMRQNPSYISRFLNDTGEWVTDSESFDDTKGQFEWFKASVNEEFEPYKKDHISYTSRNGYKSAILYITLSRYNFNSLKESIQMTMGSGETLVNDPKVKIYRCSNAEITIEVIEPLLPQIDSLFVFAFTVYSKADYESGFRLR